jgi:hypothetical protein
MEIFILNLNFELTFSSDLDLSTTTSGKRCGCFLAKAKACNKADVLSLGDLGCERMLALETLLISEA